jgi:hypothetical protein
VSMVVYPSHTVEELLRDHFAQPWADMVEKDEQLLKNKIESSLYDIGVRWNKPADYYVQLLSSMKRQASIYDLTPQQPTRDTVVRRVVREHKLDEKDFTYLDDPDDIEDWAKILVRRRKREKAVAINVASGIWLVGVGAVFVLTGIVVLTAILLVSLVIVNVLWRVGLID